MASEDDKKSQFVFARVSVVLKKRVKLEAKNRRVDQSDVVRDALVEYFEKRDTLKRGG